MKLTQDNHNSAIDLLSQKRDNIRKLTYESISEIFKNEWESRLLRVDEAIDVLKTSPQLPVDTLYDIFIELVLNDASLNLKALYELLMMVSEDISLDGPALLKLTTFFTDLGCLNSSLKLTKSELEALNNDLNSSKEQSCCDVFRHLWANVKESTDLAAIDFFEDFLKIVALESQDKRKQLFLNVLKGLDEKLLPNRGYLCKLIQFFADGDADERQQFLSLLIDEAKRQSLSYYKFRDLLEDLDRVINYKSQVLTTLLDHMDDKRYFTLEFILRFRYCGYAPEHAFDALSWVKTYEIYSPIAKERSYPAFVRHHPPPPFYGM